MSQEKRRKKTEKKSARSFNARVLRINSIYSQSDRCDGGGGDARFTNNVGHSVNYYLELQIEIELQKQMLFGFENGN